MPGGNHHYSNTVENQFARMYEERAHYGPRPRRPKSRFHLPMAPLIAAGGLLIENVAF